MATHRLTTLGAWRTCALLLSLLGAVRAAAGEPAGGEAIDRRVERTAEELLAGAVREGRVASAVVVFVRDGQVRLERAWGWEDPEKRIPVDLEQSRFAVASISKVFTAVALATYKQRGLIRSYADPVNWYLRNFRVPDSYGQPITLDELATHTAGFEDEIFDSVTDTPLIGAPAMADFEKHLPQVFCPPGTFAAYSGYGIDLLGLVLSDVSGKTYAEVVSEAILRPLGMDHTTAGYPARRIEHEVQSYQPWRPDNAVRWYSPPMSFPSSGFMTTAKDMERLLLALLDREAPQPVVTPQVREDLFRVHQEDAPYGAAHGLAFDLQRLASTVFVQHGGESAAFSCFLGLLPSESMGFFYCYTDPRPVRATPPAKRAPDRRTVQERMKAAIGVESRPLATAAGPGAWQDAWDRYLGAYLSIFRTYHGIGQLRSILHPQFLRVERGTRGLRIDGAEGFVEIAPGAFGIPGGAESFAFFPDPLSGRMALSRTAGFSAYEKPALGEDPRLLLPLLTGVLLLAASGFAFPVWPLRSHALARAAAMGFAATMVGGVAILYGTRAFGPSYYRGIAWPVLSVRLCAFLTIPLAVLLSASVIRLWSSDLRGRAALGRAHLAALAIGAWATVLLLIHVGLIGLSAPR